MYCKPLFDSAYDYAVMNIPLPPAWTRSHADMSQLVVEKMPTGHNVFGMIELGNKRRYIILPTELGNVVIAETATGSLQVPVYYIYLPQVVGAMLGIVGGSPITSVEQFRLFYDPLFKTTIRKRLRDLHSAFQALEVETTT